LATSSITAERYFDEVGKKFLVTAYHCEEWMTRGQHPDATPVESTWQEMVLPTTDEEKARNSTSAWLNVRNSSP
jgi:hypothetical protein